jgi:hypothetical protein
MKKKRSQIIVLAVIVMLVLSIGSYYYFTNYLPEQKKIEFRKQDENKKGTLTTLVAPEIVAIEHIHNEDWPVVQWQGADTKEDYFKDNVLITETTSNLMLSSKYMVFDLQTFYEEEGSYKITNKEYQLEIYDIQGKTAKKLYTIDVMKALKKANIKITQITIHNTFLENGEYMRITNNYKTEFFLELKTGKLYKADEKELTEDKEQPNASYTINCTNFEKLHKNYCFPLYNRFILHSKANMKQTYGLTKEYPEVQKLLEATEGEDTKVTVNYSQNPPTLEELLKLIIPVGEDPLKGLKTNGGEAITSYEQLEQLTNEYNEKLKQEKKNEED